MKQILPLEVRLPATVEQNPKRNKMIPLLTYVSEMAVQVSNSEGSGKKGQNDFHIAFVLSL